MILNKVNFPIGPHVWCCGCSALQKAGTLRIANSITSFLVTLTVGYYRRTSFSLPCWCPLIGEYTVIKVCEKTSSFPHRKSLSLISQLFLHLYRFICCVFKRKNRKSIYYCKFHDFVCFYKVLRTFLLAQPTIWELILNSTKPIFSAPI